MEYKILKNSSIGILNSPRFFVGGPIVLGFVVGNVFTLCVFTGRTSSSVKIVVDQRYGRILKSAISTTPDTTKFVRRG